MVFNKLSQIYLNQVVIAIFYLFQDALLYIYTVIMSVEEKREKKKTRLEN